MEDNEMTERLEKALEELNGLMAEVNDLKKDDDELVEEDSSEEGQSEVALYDSDEEDTGDSLDEGDNLDVAATDFDSEVKGRTGPEGFVEAGLAGEESQGKKHPQGGQFGPLYKEWNNDEFSTLDLSADNIEKAYEAFKAEQLEKMAYDSLKAQFANRFTTEQTVRKGAVARSEYDAKNEVEQLKEEFATLRKSLSEQTETIAKAAEISVPDVNVEDMSWGDIHNFVADYENGE